MPEDDQDTVVNSKDTVKDTVKDTDKVVSPTNAADPKPGDVIDGRYEIESVLGKGGMGTVFKAKHLHMRRPDALKILNKKLITDKHAIARFQREGRAVCALEHPNIVKIRSYGILPDKTPYMVMEYLEGKSLAKLLNDRECLPKDEALPIFCQMLDALSHAHENGVIHRDLKPDNVMLVGPEKHVKLVDFGIAKVLPMPESRKEMEKLTQTGNIFGTLLYMSPEQCMGKPLDARADLYSMGCLMYEVLDGKPPFEGEAPYVTMAKHLNEPPRESEYLKDDFGSVVLWALEKEPANRPQSARELKEALLRSLNPLSFAEKDTFKQKIAPKSRSKCAAISLTMLFIVLIAAITCTQVQRNSTRSSNSQSVRSGFQFADKRLNDYSKAVSKAEINYGPNSPEVAKRLEDMASYFHLDLGKYVEAEPLWRRSLQIKEKMLSVNPSAPNLLDVATTLQKLAQCYFDQRKFAEAVPLWKRSLSIREKILGSNDPLVATSLSALATANYDEGNYKEAEPLAKRAIAVFEKKFGPNDRRILPPLFVLAECYQKTGKYAQAEPLLNRARALQSGEPQ